MTPLGRDAGPVWWPHFGSGGGGMRTGRVLLITPNLKGLANGLSRIQPGLGVMMMAGSLRKRGHSVEIFDSALAGWERREPIDDMMVAIGAAPEDIAARIENAAPDVIGISALFSNLIESAHQIAALAKHVRPDATVVLGGNHITNAVADHLYASRHSDSGLPVGIGDVDDPNIDYAVWGEADEAFPSLVDAVLAGTD